METKHHALRMALALLIGVHSAVAQNARFFRISGPAATTITAVRADGSLVWSNALAGTNYTVQTVASLPGGTNWVDYVQLPVTRQFNTNQIIAFNAPAGMVLIPAGTFIIGDTLDGLVPNNDNAPTNVTVSAFFMDINLVSYGQWQAVYRWAITNGYSFDYPGTGKATNQPVYDVDWFDCVKWCNARSQQAGLTPIYYTDAAFTQVYTNAQLAVTNVNWSATRSAQVRPTIWPILPFIVMMSHLIPATTPTIIAPATPIPVRWVCLHRTGMVCMTWRAMNSSGVGMVMRRRPIRLAALIWAAPIHAAPAVRPLRAG